MEQQLELLWASVQTFMNQLASFLPQLIGAIVILIIGWIIAKVVKNIFVRILKTVRFEVLTEKSGVDSFLKQGGIQLTMTDVLGVLLYWMLLLLAFLAALNAMGLHVASELLNQIILYIPNVIVATIILVIGSFFARLVQGVVLVYLNNIGMSAAEGMSRVAQYAIMIFAISIALDQLGIGRELVTSAFQIAFGALCLGLALAFGLGAKDWAGGIIQKTFKTGKE